MTVYIDDYVSIETEENLATKIHVNEEGLRQIIRRYCHARDIMTHPRCTIRVPFELAHKHKSLQEMILRPNSTEFIFKQKDSHDTKS